MTKNDERILTAAERGEISLAAKENSGARFAITRAVGAEGQPTESTVMTYDDGRGNLALVNAIHANDVVLHLLADGDAAREAIRALREALEDVRDEIGWRKGEQVDEVLAQTAQWVE